MKKLFIFLAVAIFWCSASGNSKAAPLKTGDKLKQLPSPLYLDDSTRNFADFLGQKKLVILHIWEMDHATLSEFYPVSNLANRLKDEVQFVGIAFGEHEKLKKYPGAANLGFPVNSDHKGSAKELLIRPKDQLPLIVILDKDGTLLWRGPFKQAYPVIKNCLSGKFDLAEHIRVEEFAAAVNAAVSAGELEKAIEMIAAEYRKHPAKVDLLLAQISLLKKLNRLPDAYKILHEAQKHSPQNHRIFEIEYQLIGNNGELERLPEFFERVKKSFAGKPDILIAFAVAECKLPPENLQLKYAFDLAETGWESQAFKNPVQRGLYALDYASMLHSIGRNDLAVKLLEKACEDLKDNQKYLPKAKQALIYYSKLNEIAPAVKLPDLKK